MNVQSKSVRRPETVTTGPLPGSRKIYISPACSPDLRVPVREILLDASANEPNLRVYDPSGPYTEADVHFDLAAGLPQIRESWLARREGLETYQGRPVKDEDNGHVSAEALAAPCPAQRILRRGRDGALVTQYEFARAGIITEEMIFCAHRENLGREAALAGAAGRLADGESFGADIPAICTP